MILKINGMIASTYDWINDPKWHAPVADPEFVREYFGNPVHITTQKIIEDFHQADYIAHVQPGAPGSAESIVYIGDHIWKPIMDPLAHKAALIYQLFFENTDVLKAPILFLKLFGWGEVN